MQTADSGRGGPLEREAGRGTPAAVTRPGTANMYAMPSLQFMLFLWFYGMICSQFSSEPNRSRNRLPILRKCSLT